MTIDTTALENVGSFLRMPWTDFLSALLTPTIAAFGVYIARQQWILNRENLKERLFERRMEIFKGTQKFLSGILRDAAVDLNSVGDFTDVCQRSRFLFGKEMQEYLLEIRSRSIKVHSYSKACEGVPVGEKRSKLVEKEHVELKWLTDQINVIFDRFEPHLGFGIR